MSEQQSHRGAGGSPGGVGEFLLGLVMMSGGFYLLLQNIKVRSHFGMGHVLYGGDLAGLNMTVTSGMVMIPFIFGVGIMFYNSRNLIGWLLTFGSITALVFGVISTIRFTLQAMTAFELITILVLSVGGLGLFLRSLRNVEKGLDRYNDKFEEK